METSTKAQKSPYKIVDLIDGQRDIAVSYMPEMKGIAAVVDLKTLIRITSGLQKYKFDDMKTLFCERLMEATTMEEYVDLLQDELAFQMTCNKITTTSFDEAKADVARAEAALADSRKPLTEEEMKEIEDVS